MRKRRKKIAAIKRVPSELPKEPGKLWTMDFVSDSVAFNRKLKILTTLDPVTNVSPVIHPGYSITGKDLTFIIERACEAYGYPDVIRTDNGPEFRSREFDQWCYRKGIQIDYINPGKPVENCHIESFNGTFRTECLNSHYFETLKDARAIINEWWNEYNNERPQKRLKGMTPRQYEDKLNSVITPMASGRKTG